MSDSKTWGGTVGPIQLKKFKGALGSIRRAGQSTVELYGVMGGEEHRSMVMWSPFSPPSEESQKRLAALGDKWQWTVSRDNVNTIIAEALAISEELYKNVPVKDTRRTAEQEAERLAKHQAAEAERTEKDAKLRAERDALVPQLRAKYPWAVQDRDGLNTHARCAQNIRTELSRTFPGIEFRVRSEYNRVTIHWELGPCEKDLKEQVTGKYVSSSWVHDGGDGYRQVDHSAMGEALDVVLGRVEYISTSRSHPGFLLDQVCTFLKELQHKPELPNDKRGLLGDGDCYSVMDHAYQVCARTSFPAGAKVTGVVPDEGEGSANDWCKLTLEVAPVAVPVTGSEGVRVVRNEERNGVEIHFPAKPDTNTLARLKGSGWRWSMRSKCWYAKYTPDRESQAYAIAGVVAA